MNEVLYIISGSFDMLTRIKIWNIPVMYILIGLVVLYLVMDFIKGQRS